MTDELPTRATSFDRRVYGSTFGVRLKRPASRTAATVLCLAVSGGLAAQTQPGDSFNLDVRTQRVHDDNLFRLPNGVLPQSGNSRSEQIRTLSGNLESTLRLGLQTLNLEAGLDRNWFTRYPNLDYTGARIAARIDWRIASLLDGIFGYSDSRRLAAFGDTGLESQDLIRTRSPQISAALRVTPQQRLGIEWSQLQTRRSDPSQRLLDNNLNGFGPNWSYTSGAGNVVGIRARRSSAEYRLASAAQNGFTQRDVQLFVRTTEDRVTSWTGEWGYTSRDYVSPSQRDFSGTTGSIGVQWRPGAKLVVSADVQRMLQPPDDPSQAYVLATGWRLSARWPLNDTLGIDARYEREHRRFAAASTAAVTRPNETPSRLSFGVSYAPVPVARFGASISQGERHSADAARRYDDQQIQIAVELRF
jgi:hypothetical protein